MPKNHTWYVSFNRANAVDGKKQRASTRLTQTFETEADARAFASEIENEGSAIIAGTINPQFPKRTISPDEMRRWLNFDSSDALGKMANRPRR